MQIFCSLLSIIYYYLSFIIFSYYQVRPEASENLRGGNPQAELPGGQGHGAGEEEGTPGSPGGNGRRAASPDRHWGGCVREREREREKVRDNV